MSANKNIFHDLQFEQRHDGKKYTAFCLICKKILQNTAAQRLKLHRNVCKLEDKTENDVELIILDQSQDNEEISFMDISQCSVDEISFTQDCDLASTPTTAINTAAPLSFLTTPSLSSLSGTVSSTSLSSYPSTSSLHSHSSQEIFKPPKSSKASNIRNYIDAVSKKEEEDINSSIAQFFFGCNIPLNVIESDLFKNMIKKLRPSFYKSIPSKKVLSTSLLESEYKKEIENSKKLLGKESVMLIDGWKNTASNTKIVVTMLHNAKGNKSFLNAYDFSIDSETVENLAMVVENSIDLAESIYDTKIYAVVSDNAANMIKMGRLINIWHINCSAHVANLLAKDVVDKELVGKVTTIMKEFRNPDLEKIVLEKGGCKMKMPCETRWNSYRDCCACLTKNLKYMRECVMESHRKIKQEVKNLLFDDIFIENVEEMVCQLNPICVLLNKVQSADCTVAECGNLWLSLAEPDDLQLRKKFKERKLQALNIYVLTSYYLNPFLDKNQLSESHVDSITTFLIQRLNGAGLHELDLFLEKKEHFQVLLSKDLKDDAFLFWRMASLKYPTLSNLALKLLSIPASSAQIERLFSNWNYVHSDLRNKLTFERSKKLIHIYYNKKINKTTSSTEEDE